MPTVSIKSKNQSFKVSQGEILFDALEKQGCELPHGCLAGSCGACRIEIVSGDELLSQPSEVEQNTIDSIKVNYARKHGEEFLKNKIIRLSCRAKIEHEGDIELEDI